MREGTNFVQGWTHGVMPHRFFGYTCIAGLRSVVAHFPVQHHQDIWEHLPCQVSTSSQAKKK